VLRKQQQVKKAGREINALAPNETLYAVNPDYQPIFFYVKAPVQYVSNVKNLPRDVHYFLVRSADEVDALATGKGAPLGARPIARVHDIQQTRDGSLRSASANRE